MQSALKYITHRYLLRCIDVHRLLLPATVSRTSAAEEVKSSVEIGDRVWVGGTKAGIVVFIGPTQFAAGEWVGVELDAAVGKNDGSVNGVRYFSCTPLHGVFAKAAKLTKRSPTDDAPESGVASAATSQSSINTSAEGNGATAGKQEVVSSSSAEATADTENSTLLESPSSDMPVFDVDNAGVSDVTAADTSEMPPPAQAEKQTKRGMIPRPMHGSTASLHRGLVAGSTADLAASGDATKMTLKLGDRVIVSGSKVGTVRYVGTTEFAKGDWIGVELDEPLGKNDGSVQGKR